MSDIFKPAGHRITNTRASFLKLIQPLRKTNYGQKTLSHFIITIIIVIAIGITIITIIVVVIVICSCHYNRFYYPCYYEYSYNRTSFFRNQNTHSMSFCFHFCFSKGPQWKQSPSAFLCFPAVTPHVLFTILTKNF